MTRINRVFALVLVLVLACTTVLAACAPISNGVLSSMPEPKPTTAPTAAPTATPTASPIPTPTPEPYFDLENMTDEDLFLAYKMSGKATENLIGFAFDNGGLFVIEYVVDDVKCITLTGGDDLKGNISVFGDYPFSLRTKQVYISTNTQSFDEADLATCNEDDFDCEPFPGELINGNSVKSIMITRVFPLSLLRRYMELQGLSVPETKWSENIEGLEMIGNVVSIMGQFRYFLTVAPHDEVMNHFKLNYSDTVAATDEP